jgi:hypothetical protein
MHGASSSGDAMDMAGAALLAECCQAYGPAWLTCLKFRLPQTLRDTIEAAKPIDAGMARARLEWVCGAAIMQPSS